MPSPFSLEKHSLQNKDPASSINQPKTVSPAALWTGVMFAVREFRKDNRPTRKTLRTNGRVGLA